MEFLIPPHILQSQALSLFRRWFTHYFQSGYTAPSPMRPDSLLRLWRYINHLFIYNYLLRRRHQGALGWRTDCWRLKEEFTGRATGIANSVVVALSSSHGSTAWLVISVLTTCRSNSNIHLTQTSALCSNHYHHHHRDDQQQQQHNPICSAIIYYVYEWVRLS